MSRTKIGRQHISHLLILCIFVIHSSRLALSATCGCVSSASTQQLSPVSNAAPMSAGSQATPTEDQLGSGAVRLIEGDILVSQQQLQEQSQMQDESISPFSASSSSSFYWPNGTLYYSVSSEYTASEVTLIDTSLRELQAAVRNAVTFKKVTPGQVADYVSASSGTGCNSYVGRQKGAQTLSLQRGVCLQKYIIQHEFIHALGYWHEQSRPDRDKFVNIWWSYIDAGKCSNFGIFGTQPPSDYPAYDSSSIMHYDSFAFSCDGSSATMTSKSSGIIPYPMKLTSSDLLRIQYYYGPGDNSTSYSVTASRGQSANMWLVTAAAASFVLLLASMQ